MGGSAAATASQKKQKTATADLNAVKQPYLLLLLVEEGDAASDFGQLCGTCKIVSRSGHRFGSPSRRWARPTTRRAPSERRRRASGSLDLCVLGGLHGPRGIWDLLDSTDYGKVRRRGLAKWYVGFSLTPNHLYKCMQEPFVKAKCWGNVHPAKQSLPKVDPKFKGRGSIMALPSLKRRPTPPAG